MVNLEFKKTILDSKLKKNFQHFIGISFLFICSCLSAQTSINSTDFLQKRLQQSDNFTGNSTTTTSNFKAFWLEELVFRTETRDFDFDRQSYTLRLRPSVKKVRQAQKRMAQQFLEEAAIERKNYAFKFVELAYTDWIELYSIEQKLKVHKNLLAVYSDIEKVLLQLGKKEELKVKDLLEVKSDITSTQIAIQTLEVAQKEFLPTQQADFSDLIPIEAIGANLLIPSKNIASSLGKTQKKSLKEAVIQTEIDLELAEQKRYFDFFQIEYRGPHDDLLRERFSIGAGLKIPFTGGNQLKVEELKVEQALLEEEYQLDLAIFEIEVAKEKQALRAVIAEHQVSKQLIQRQQQQAKELITRLVSREGSTPLLQLYYQIEQSKQALNLAKLETNIYEQYIKYLSLTEELFTTPFRNFLVN